MRRDLRFAVRTLARNPGFSALVVFTLALGIGATTAVFDLVNLLYWRRPPVTRPQEVVAVFSSHPQPFIGAYGPLSWPDFVDYRNAVRTTRLVAYRATWTRVDVGNGAEGTGVYQVTGAFFSALGIRPALGRMLGPDDHRAGAAPVAVMGHARWVELGSDPEIVGRGVRVSDRIVQVVGVAPPGFHGMLAGPPVALLLPAEIGLGGVLETERGDRTQHAWSVFARLPPGVSAAQLQAELTATASHLDQEHPLASFTRKITVQTATISHPIDQARYGTTLQIVSAAVGLLLLIACASVSNLLLVRAIERRREMGIRQSIGASRWRLVRQLLTESLVLAIAGGTGGLLLALAARQLMAGYLGQGFVASMRLDHRVLGATLLVSCAVTLLFGLAPALLASRVRPVTALEGATPIGGLRGRLSMRSLLAAAQVALVLVLLVCCGLLAEDLWRSSSADLGFEADNLLVLHVDLPEQADPATGRDVFRRLRERAQAIPGVGAAGMAAFVPPERSDITVGVSRPELPEDMHRSRYDFVDSESFSALGLPLHEGRLFQPQDEQKGHGVAVINRVLADKLWPGQSALGRTLRLDRSRPSDPGTDYEVVGVVGSVTQFALARAPEPVIYFTWAQRYTSYLSLLVRTVGIDSRAVLAGLREELRQVDPAVTLHFPQTHDEYRWEVLVDERLRTQTLSLFAGAGLFLALLGVFGVTSYSVSQQRREIGIRIAVGARQNDLLRWVLGRGLALSVAGIGAGLVASLWAVQVLRGAVPGLGPAHPGLVAAAAAFLLVASGVAVWFPARRASRADPVRALREG
jgi:putative ABC transport system permease protein